MTKIFGIGWARTGTTTLGQSLKILGYRHQSQRLDLVTDVARGDLARVWQVVEAFDSFDDWPWIILFKELDAHYPGSKFILTTRDPQKWLKSYANLLAQEANASPELHAARRVLYGLPFPDVTPEQLLARYQAHHTAVAEHFQARPEALLTISWEQGDGWEKLCAFLGRPVPTVPFPHENRGHYRPPRAAWYRQWGKRLRNYLKLKGWWQAGR